MNTTHVTECPKKLLYESEKAVKKTESFLHMFLQVNQNSFSSNYRASGEGFSSPIKHRQTPFLQKSLGDEDEKEGNDFDVESEGMEEEEQEDPFGAEDDREPSIIDYDDERCIDDERTESQLRQMEGKHKLTLQQLKEHLLGGVSYLTILLADKNIYKCCILMLQRGKSPFMDKGDPVLSLSFRNESIRERVSVKNALKLHK